MKKKFVIIFLFTFHFSFFNVKAQWVTIPDAAFASWLDSHFPSCMNGNQMDTTCTAILQAHSLNCQSQNFNSMNGIQYFKSLRKLDCRFASIGNIPKYPDSLTYFDCYECHIDSIAKLPSSLRYLDLQDNNMGYNTILLPDSISYLNIQFCWLNYLSHLPYRLDTFIAEDNNFVSLPALPSSLKYLDCRSNLLTLLPSLPSGLIYLNCAQDSLTSLPPLPNSLKYLQCYYNKLFSLPTLPDSLRYLDCNGDSLLTLPVLPSKLISLSCGFNKLTSLPTLPNYLSNLDCNVNQLTSLPQFPQSLVTINCVSDNLYSLPTLPDTMYWLNCGGNPNLSCLPVIRQIQYLYFNGTSIHCIPDIPFGIVSMSPVTLPLCTPLDDCPFAWNVQGNVHADTSANCFDDSLHEGVGMQNLKVQLIKNGNVEEQMYVTQLGQYSFDRKVSDTFQLKVDTTNLPFYAECPNGGIRNEIISTSDSLHYNRDFGLRCNGVADLGVQAIYDRFALNHPISSVEIEAGDMTHYYNLDCSNDISGIVTVTINGPVSFYAPGNNSLTPSSVSGNVITYTVPDFGAINFFNAFNFVAQVNSNAVIGNPVCITVNISTALPELNYNNNSLTHCVNIVSSYDPNEKDVSPMGNINNGDWLTYDIHFQNTGTDTAYTVQIKDTLSNNLEPETFSFLASSHNCVTQIKNHEVIFSFAHILLVDSFTNEPASRGWVQFKIKSKNPLPDGAEINNSASIYFDGNSPVKTNTTSNHIKFNPSLFDSNSAFWIFPNPTNDAITCWFNSTGEHEVSVMDATGRNLFSFVTSKQSANLDVSNYSEGIYFVKVRSSEGVSAKKFLKISK